MRMRLSLLLLLCAGLVASGSDAATFFVLRHAEKLAEGRDPELSPAGQARAEHLARMLSDAGITRILTTDYRRTRATVQPLAGALGIEPEIYDPRDLPGLVDRLRESGGRCVVVGHSNTTPAVVELLGGDAGPPIDDATEFDRLYLLYADSADQVTTVVLRYGVR